jgi:hypothetical protein
MRIEIHYAPGQMAVFSVDAVGDAAVFVGLDPFAPEWSRALYIQVLAAALANELMAGRNEQPEAEADFTSALRYIAQASAYGVAAANTPRPPG